jgi:hypothetical protein
LPLFLVLEEGNYHCLSGALDAYDPTHGSDNVTVLPWAEVVRSLFAQAEKKVNLGIGAYRDESGKPWVLECVKAVSFLRYTLHLQKPRISLLSCNGLYILSKSVRASSVQTRFSVIENPYESHVL